MEKRLRIAKELLTEEGVIFISIEDNEQAQLKLLCDEVFGGENFSNMIAVKMSEVSGVKMTHVNKKLPKLKEYIFMYKKNKDSGINEIKVTKNTWDKEYNSILLNITKDELKQIDEIIASGEKNRMLNTDLINKILIKVDFFGVKKQIKYMAKMNFYIKMPIEFFELVQHLLNLHKKLKIIF